MDSSSGATKNENGATAEEIALLPEGVAEAEIPVELLFRDLVWLFASGDTDGGLMSLERLLVLAAMTDRLRSFLRTNETKLMELFETVVGPWTNVPHKTNRDTVPRFFRTDEKFAVVLHLVNGERDIARILEVSFYSPLETCAMLNQLFRSRVIEIV